VSDDDRADRLSAMAAALGWALEPVGARALVAYLDAMLAENRSVNLTGVRDPDAALVLHCLDSLAVGRCGLSPARALDLGSGNGFPGIAVRALFPDAQLVLMDRTGKKLAAIERALANAGIDGVETRHLDAEQARARAPDLVAGFELVTARAVGEASVAVRLAAPLLARDGVLALWVAGEQRTPDRLDGLHIVGQHAYELPEPAPRRRRLVVYARPVRT
jgi:16S rRNA (guanine527-N7)-methyltransferase